MARGLYRMIDKYGEFSSLAVSGQCCAGKSTLCRILSKKLKWKHVDVGSEFRKIAKLQGLRIEEFGSIPDEILRNIDDQICHGIETKEYTIWDGRLTCYLARDKTMVFKVYCTANLDIRANRAANRDNISIEEAKKNVLARDAEEARVFKRLYGFSDPYDPKWANLYLDTSSDSPEELANIVIQMLRTLAGY